MSWVWIDMGRLPKCRFCNPYVGCRTHRRAGIPCRSNWPLVSPAHAKVGPDFQAYWRIHMPAPSNRRTLSVVNPSMAFSRGGRGKSIHRLSTTQPAPWPDPRLHTIVGAGHCSRHLTKSKRWGTTPIGRFLLRRLSFPRLTDRRRCNRPVRWRSWNTPALRQGHGCVRAPNASMLRPRGRSRPCSR